MKTLILIAGSALFLASCSAPPVQDSKLVAWPERPDWSVLRRSEFSETFVPPFNVRE